jgi:hypothetical protein
MIATPDRLRHLEVNLFRLRSQLLNLALIVQVSKHLLKKAAGAKGLGIHWPQFKSAASINH